MAEISDEQVERALRKVFVIQAEGTSQSESGYGAPYGPPFFIIDTSTAEPEVNWPGELIEQVDAVSEVGKRLHAARVAALRAALLPRPVEAGVPKVKALQDAAKAYMSAVRRLGEQSGYNNLSFFEAPISKMPDDTLGMEAVRRWQALNDTGKALTVALDLPTSPATGDEG